MLVRDVPARDKSFIDQDLRLLGALIHDPFDPEKQREDEELKESVRKHERQGERNGRPACPYEIPRPLGRKRFFERRYPLTAMSQPSLQGAMLAGFAARLMYEPDAVVDTLVVEERIVGIPQSQISQQPARTPEQTTRTR